MRPRPAKTRAIHRHEIQQFLVAVWNFQQQQKSSQLCQRFNNQHAGHDWRTGKMSLKIPFVYGDILDADDAFLSLHF